MKYISNLHTHTNYCDGKNSIEENIKYAIEKEFISLGFSVFKKSVTDEFEVDFVSTSSIIEPQAPHAGHLPK